MPIIYSIAEIHRERKENGIKLLLISLRGLQIPEKKVHARLHLRALLPSRGASKIRPRAQNLRCQQRDQAAQRAPPSPERRRRQLARLRSRGAREGPSVWLRRSHLFPSETGPEAAEGARCC